MSVLNTKAGPKRYSIDRFHCMIFYS